MGKSLLIDSSSDFDSSSDEKSTGLKSARFLA